MASEKTRAIVLRVVEFSETSCVVTLFTENFGKIGALAKGARRPKSPLEGALDLLALVRIVFLHKSSEALDLLTEAKLERRFRSAQRDLPRLYAGYYVAELLRELTEPGDPHPELFAAADAALLALDSGQGVPETVLRFEVAALRLAGHWPSLDACAVCGREVETENGRRIPLGMVSGGVLCEVCRSGRRGVVSVSGTLLNALRRAGEDDFMEKIPAAGDERQTTEPGEKPAPFRLAESIRGELRAVMSNYFAHLLGHRLQLSPYLGPVARPSRP